MANGILDFFSHEAGQQRRKALDEAIEYYIPPNLRGLLGFAAEMTPTRGSERAGQASQKLFAPDTPGWERVSALGDMASEIAGVVAPAAVAGKVGMPAAQALQEGLMGFSTSPQGMALRNFAGDESGALRLFHGSPHDFDKFSMGKIGTGEGAQAYGHGLYFAENENVAKGYRDTLSSSPFRAMVSKNPNDVAAGAIKLTRGDRTAAAQMLRENLADVDLGSGAEPVRAAIALLEGGGDIRPPGHLYEVNVNANPEDFLDWDKPLSEQPQKVRDVLRSFGASPDDVGAKAYARAGVRRFSVLGPDGRWGPGGATYEESLTKAGGDAAKVRQTLDPSAPNRSEGLRQAGIPGIRYLDQGSRGAGEGSRNYVVFDDKLIDIVKKYGIAGAAAMLGVNAIDVEQAMAQGRPQPQGLLGYGVQ